MGLVAPGLEGCGAQATLHGCVGGGKRSGFTEARSVHIDALGGGRAKSGLAFMEDEPGPTCLNLKRESRIRLLAVWPLEV